MISVRAAVAPQAEASPAMLRGEIEDAAQAVLRLSPHRRDPEGFHRDKSEIAAALRRLARQVGKVAA